MMKMFFFHSFPLLLDVFDNHHRNEGIKSNGIPHFKSRKLITFEKENRTRKLKDIIIAIIGSSADK